MNTQEITDVVEATPIETTKQKKIDAFTAIYSLGISAGYGVATAWGIDVLWQVVTNSSAFGEHPIIAGILTGCGAIVGGVRALDLAYSGEDTVYNNSECDGFPGP